LTTPEGVTLDLPLAGIGSRATAAIIDTVIQGFAIWMGILVLPTVVEIVAIFVVFFGYHVLFETLAGGKTPGKRMLRLRVVRSDGGPVTFAPSLIRTLLRLVDGLPVGYVVGMVTVFASSRNQRLGDMAAGTAVLQEPELRREMRGEVSLDFSLIQGIEGWDVTDVSAEEMAVVRRFVTRRFAMDYHHRTRLAAQLASRLDGKVHRPQESIDAERFLVKVLAAKERHRA